VSGGLNTAALEPLFRPWEEPKRHRVEGESDGGPARILDYRRPADAVIAQNLRASVKAWREGGYGGVSETSRILLHHWFGGAHAGGFRYHFCQREAVETLVYLMEARGLCRLAPLVAEYGGHGREEAAAGIEPESDLWARYAFKLGTGTGKTKCMALAIVWSYFHALREGGSDMARHFVVIAPNLTVFERLREDFAPPDGGLDIFHADPMLPPQWRADWRLPVVLQDEAGGGDGGPALYLTNIHRLFPQRRARKGEEEDGEGWAGPPVARAAALDTAKRLRERITAHGRVMVLNDEAHHVWDPDSAWSESIRWLHDTIGARGGGGLAAQLDFSATPKDNKGILFPHIVCESPLGEAVDAGIVKVPVIGHADNLKDIPSDAADVRFEAHLRLGYDRWRASCAQWEGSGKRPLMFVMCEDTKAADAITRRLNRDTVFSDLNGKTINLHTNLKGKIKKRRDGTQEFVPSEKDISDDDLKALRKLSRDLDRPDSPYSCIVSVLMLREGWDVRNVTTIVPLRPYSSKAGILPEQTLGRGLRRMTGPGATLETVTVVEHPAFVAFYKKALAEEGVLVQDLPADKIPPTTVTIFPDPKKDWAALDIALPALSAGHTATPHLEGLTLDDVREGFKRFGALPLDKATHATEITYEGRQLITQEVVEATKIHLPLLASGHTAISYFVREMAVACKLQDAHRTLAPLLEGFLGTILFGQSVALDDPRLVRRLSDQDVQEYIRATFLPLIRARTVTARERAPEPGRGALRLRDWKGFAATHTAERPCKMAARTLFNLVPCNRGLEVSLTAFLDAAPDVAAFAKNAGPQALRIDYLTADGRPAAYTPDFLVRMEGGQHCVVETKGREDREVPLKAKAAVAWCKAASRAGGAKWDYVFVTEGLFEGVRDTDFAALQRACVPALKNLLSAAEPEPELPLFGDAARSDRAEIVPQALLAKLSPGAQTAVAHAQDIFAHLENKAGMSLAPAFQPLLGPYDKAAERVLVRLLRPLMPTDRQEQDHFFAPYLGSVGRKTAGHYERLRKELRRTLVYGNTNSPIGLLRDCYGLALEKPEGLGGVLAAAQGAFALPGAAKMAERLKDTYAFRNAHVAHGGKDATDPETARTQFLRWVETMALLGA
jgi:type III restriction enzyme